MASTSYLCNEISKIVMEKFRKGLVQLYTEKFGGGTECELLC